MDWKELKAEILSIANASVEECPEDILRVFEYEIGEEGCGTGDLMIGPWVEGATASR